MVSATRPVDLASRQMRLGSRAVVVSGRGLEEALVAKEDPKVAVASVEAALHSEGTNRPLARRLSHHLSAV